MWSNDFEWLFKQGEPDGFNDPGISEFKSVKYDGLAREIIQNSLDAKDPNIDQPVKVVFEHQVYDSKYFPGYESLSKTVDACLDYIKDENGNKSLKDLADLKEFLSSVQTRNKFNVMKISDFNTVGLMGALERKGTPWANLVRRAGNSNKKIGAGGSFGVGKYAPFVFSAIRSIIYSTKDLEGNIAVQGKSILSGHILESIERSPKGYFGHRQVVKIDDREMDDSFPITNPDDMPEEFIKKETGTSLYILCAKIERNWREEVRNAVINSFFWAILNGKLEVEVISGGDSILINKETLFASIEKALSYDNKNKETLLTKEYLKIFTNPNDAKVFRGEFDLTRYNKKETGTMEMIVYSNKHIEAKSIAHIRETGMKIEDKGYRSLIGYVGISKTTNEQMNRFLRECEAPKHDKWSSNNFGNSEEDAMYAKNILGELEKWERNIIKSLNSYDATKKIDPLGMEEYLPSDVSDNTGNQADEEILNFKPLETELKLKKNSKQTYTINNNGGIALDENGEEELEGGNGYNQGKGGNKAGNGGEIRNGNAGGGSISEKVRIPIKYIRTPYLNEDGKYLISFVSLEQHENCELKIRRAGVDILEEAKIKELYLLENDEKIEITNFNLNSNEKKMFEVKIDGIEREVLEVSCYAKK